ncbi:MAG: restriction endonuclease subunit S [Actinomycetota bacterium]
MTGEATPALIADLIAAGELAINDGYRAKNSELSPRGLPFARAANINGGFKFDGADRFPEEHLDRVGNKVSHPGDVVFTSKGTVGRFALVRVDTPRFVYSPQLCFWRSLNRERIDPRWLFYWMQSREFFAQYSGVAGQTDMAEYVNLRDQRSMSITLPPVGEERAIAHILGTLDDKIELNRRMNETLEAMARAIFKSWFVDFDPVRAKMDGRWRRGESLSGLPAHLYDLFPDRLVDSELGEIPKGWRVMSVGDLADVAGGTTPSTKELTYWEGGTHAWATPKDLSGLSVPVLLDTERRITDAGLSQIGSGLLPRGTVLLSSRAPIGYLAVSDIPVAINQGFIAMTPKAGTSNLFLLLWASVAHEEIVSRANGSTFLEISKANFRPIPVVTPSSDVMQSFEELARPLFGHIVKCARESRTLAAVRDALLPKLISGELRVKDVEFHPRDAG